MGFTENHEIQVKKRNPRVAKRGGYLTRIKRTLNAYPCLPGPKSQGPIMHIEIVNWSKYNPRGDVKSTSWFRLENTFWANPMLTKLDSDGKLVWIVLLSMASQRQSAVFELDLKFVRSVIGVRMKKLISLLQYFQECEKIRIDCVPASRGRNAHVPLRTDGTNETNETNKKRKEKAGPASAAPPDPPSDEANLPKSETTEWDTKAAAWLQKAIALHNPMAKPPPPATHAKWADVFGLLRVDFGEAAVKELLLRIFEPGHPDFVIDPFWRINVQSPKDLRKHWNRITAQISNSKPKAQGYAL